MTSRLTCFVLVYLKQNKQEIGKRIQAKILGVSIGWEHNIEEWQWVMFFTSLDHCAQICIFCGAEFLAQCNDKILMMSGQ